jgi:C-terminal processing protease CtpA/Prc
MKFNKIIFPAAILIGIAWSPMAAAAEDSELEAAREAAEQQRRQAEELRDVASVKRVEAEAMKVEQAEALEQARVQMRVARDELRRAQAEMREASRGVSEAQRHIMKEHEIAIRGIATAPVLDFANRAMIGVIMGESDAENGVSVIGLTPGGPAEIAGLQKGDVITAVNGRALNVVEDIAGAEIIKDEISSLEPGDEVQLQLERDGINQTITVVTQAREPLTVHSMIRVPNAPEISEQVLRIIEQVEIPEVDVAVLEDKLAIIEEKLIDGEWSFGGPHYNVQFAPGSEFKYEKFSDLANSAIDNTMVWFGGSSYVQGLQFAAMNDDLGVYFDTPEGVLVLRAKTDNSLDLRSGDVILEINGNAVNQPADVMRELRFVEDSSEAELLVMRNKNVESLMVTLPERKIQKFEFHVAPEVEE